LFHPGDGSPGLLSNCRDFEASCEACCGLGSR